MYVCVCINICGRWMAHQRRPDAAPSEVGASSAYDSTAPALGFGVEG